MVLPSDEMITDELNFLKTSGKVTDAEGVVVLTESFLQDMTTAEITNNNRAADCW